MKFYVNDEEGLLLEGVASLLGKSFSDYAHDIMVPQAERDRVDLQRKYEGILPSWWLTETTPEAREKIIQKLREAKEIAEKSRSENNS